MKLGVLRLGLAIGIVWGLSVVFLGVMAAAFAWGQPAVNLLGSVYTGYAATTAGILIGALWGLVDGFIGGVLIAWVYNLLGSAGVA